MNRRQEILMLAADAIDQMVELTAGYGDDEETLMDQEKEYVVEFLRETANGNTYLSRPPADGAGQPAKSPVGMDLLGLQIRYANGEFHGHRELRRYLEDNYTGEGSTVDKAMTKIRKGIDGDLVPP